MNISLGTLQKEVELAIGKSHDYLFAVQRPDGSWRDHVASSAVATAVALCALYHADQQRFATLLSRGCSWLEATQHEDGGWGDATTDASTLNATSLSVSALKLIDPEGAEQAIHRALAYIDGRGGFAAVANPKECSMSVACLGFLALAGLHPWEGLSRIPLELILFPKRFWMRFSITMPGIFSWGLIHDRKLLMSAPRRWLGHVVRPKVLKWIESTRGVNGSWEDSPLLTGMVSLGLVISGVAYERVAPGLSYLLATQREDGSWAGEEDLELSVTTFILGGLEEVGAQHDIRLEGTRDWLLASQHDEPFSPTACPGGWWSWRLPSGWPDTDDTAGAITALRHLGVSTADPHILKGCNWLCLMQNRDGSWGMFVKDCHSPMDEPCPALTARVVLALHDCLGGAEHARYSRAIARAMEYLKSVQRADGALHTIWYETLVYGTAIVLDAYTTLQCAEEPVALNCREWLLATQRVDGSWGDDKQQPGTVEETAWALAALAAPGVGAPQEVLDRAASWLVQRQDLVGSWPPSVIGYYATALRYSSDHIANGFALRALGRYARLRAAKETVKTA